MNVKTIETLEVSVSVILELGVLNVLSNVHYAGACKVQENRWLGCPLRVYRIYKPKR